jgi:hypothetical protein
MRKKMLLIVVVGVFFSPTVFAVENKISNTDMRGVQCTYDKVLKAAADTGESTPVVRAQPIGKAGVAN